MPSGTLKAANACAFRSTTPSAPPSAPRCRLRLLVSKGHIPPPLADSQKCPRCARGSICLPDEVGALKDSPLAPRPIAVPADDALLLIVQSLCARIAEEGETLTIDEVQEKHGAADRRLRRRGIRQR